MKGFMVTVLGLALLAVIVAVFVDLIGGLR